MNIPLGQVQCVRNCLPRFQIDRASSTLARRAIITIDPCMSFVVDVNTTAAWTTSFYLRCDDFIDDCTHASNAHTCHEDANWDVCVAVKSHLVIRASRVISTSGDILRDACQLVLLCQRSWFC